MGQFFSDQTEEALRLIYTQYNKQEFIKAEKLLRDSAKSGDADAWYFLSIYMRGKEYIWEFGGFPQDEQKSLEMLKHSVLRGSALGVIESLLLNQPEFNNGMPFASLEEAFNVVQNNAQAGQGYCQYMMGRIYQSGVIKEINSNLPPTDLVRTAATWYEKTLRQGYYWCAGPLLDIYEKGEYSISKDMDKYKKLLNICVSSGNPVYEQRLGHLFKDNKDFGKALKCYESSIKKGHLKAWLDVAHLYEKGRGVEKNLEYAFTCYEQAAQAGVKRAQSIFGKAYYYGRGTEVDFLKAAYWLKRAEDPFGYPELSDCYLRGLGVDYNYQKALELLEQSEQSGLTLFNLGLINAEGLGVPRDILKGCEYFKRAAGQGFTDAQKQLKRYQRYTKAPLRRNLGIACLLAGLLLVSWVILTKQTVVFTANSFEEYQEILEKGYPYAELKGGLLANTGSGYQTRVNGVRKYGAYFLYTIDGKFGHTFLVSLNYDTESEFLNAPRVVENTGFTGKIKKRGDTEKEVISKMVSGYGVKEEDILDGVLIESQQYERNIMWIYSGCILVVFGLVTTLFFGKRAMALRIQDTPHTNPVLEN